MQVTSTHNHYDLSMNGNNLIINNLEQNYFDQGELVTIDCNGIQNTLTLTINNIDDPAQWQPLQDQSTREDVPDLVIIYSKLKQMCTDIDNNLNFEITSTHQHYDLQFYGDDLTIKNLEQDYFDLNGEIITVECNNIPASFNLIINNTDDPAQWTQTPLNNQNIDEDSSDNTIVYQDIKLLCTDVDSTTNMQITSTHNHYNLSINGDHLTITNLEQNYNDPNGELITLDCNGIQNNFTLIINSIDDPTIWQPLQDQSIQEDSPDNTIIYPALKQLCTDIDNPVDVNIVSTHAFFDLEFIGNDLSIKNLEQNYNDPDGEVITVECNGIQASFNFAITETDDPAQWSQAPLDNQNIDEDSPDNTIVYQDIKSLCTDPDSPINMQVTSTHNHYDLFINGNNLIINNLEQNYFDQGELITVNCNGIQNTFTLTINSINDGPKADFTMTPYPILFKKIEFDGSLSTDADGYITDYIWDFGDGTKIQTTNSIIKHTYYRAYPYTVKLTVIDNDGNSDTKSVSIRINPTQTKTKKPQGKLLISRIQFGNSEIEREGNFQPGDNLRMFFELENSGDINLDDLRITVTIPEMDERRKITHFNLDQGNTITKALTIDIPEWIKPGEYITRIVIQDLKHNIKRVKHRFINIV